jgi:hypothetical protein
VKKLFLYSLRYFVSDPGRQQSKFKVTLARYLHMVNLIDAPSLSISVTTHNFFPSDRIVAVSAATITATGAFITRTNSALALSSRRLLLLWEFFTVIE